ncbi:phage antirepressor KilAC domain-containing protein [Xenorhabdus kozodoii]|uniref:DNA-binding protein n=1 Tax=Xenorhabdus kozodoii TaxID=351676 RepID=A0A2D0L050_9GAMM|nr:phage regulatory protein/antirepressor Ant [Xenorhabdus kozodoii]PHM69038.1 DNA-binding protein [Xenorhabdus kozodoii]
MKILAPATQAVTMSSREIAELTGKEHKHVVRDIEKMLTDLEIYSPDLDFNDFKGFSINRGTYKGRDIIESIDLDQDLTMTLVMGYKVQLRHKVAKRWRELETGIAQPQIPQSLPEALRLAADLAEQKAELEHKVEEMKPDVAALERIAKSDGSMCVTDAAKQLQVKPKSLFDLMSHNKWIYRRMGTPWVGYQEKIQQRLIEHKVTVVIKPDGEEKTVSQVRITPKGISKLAKMLSVKEAA